MVGSSRDGRMDAMPPLMQLPTGHSLDVQLAFFTSSCFRERFELLKKDRRSNLLLYEALPGMVASTQASYRTTPRRQDTCCYLLNTTHTLRDDLLGEECTRVAAFASNSKHSFAGEPVLPVSTGHGWAGRCYPIDVPGMRDNCNSSTAAATNPKCAYTDIRYQYIFVRTTVRHPPPTCHNVENHTIRWGQMIPGTCCQTGLQHNTMISSTLDFTIIMCCEEHGGIPTCVHP